MNEEGPAGAVLVVTHVWLSLYLRELPAVDEDDHACDVRRQVRTQPSNGGGYLFRQANSSHRHRPGDGVGTSTSSVRSAPITSSTTRRPTSSAAGDASTSSSTRSGTARWPISDARWSGVAMPPWSGSPVWRS